MRCGTAAGNITRKRIPHLVSPRVAAARRYTIGVDFAIKRVVRRDYEIKLQIWDFAGQERFRLLQQRFFIGATMGVLVFDLTRFSSFQNLNSWLREFWRYNNKGIIPVAVVGNKLDLRNEGMDLVNSELGFAFCEKISRETIEHGFEVPYLETSAKSCTNITPAFDILIDILVDRLEQRNTFSLAN